jgi:hypothetical protein
MFTPQSFEPVMAALFAQLVASATFTFTADATATSAVLANVSSFTGSLRRPSGVRGRR